MFVWDNEIAFDFDSWVSNWTRPKPLDFQFLWSEEISQAKIVDFPVWDSRKWRRSMAVDDRGMLVTLTVAVVVVVVVSCTVIGKDGGYRR